MTADDMAVGLGHPIKSILACASDIGARLWADGIRSIAPCTAIQAGPLTANDIADAE